VRTRGRTGGSAAGAGGPDAAGPQWPSTVSRSASFRPPSRRGIVSSMSTRPRSQAGPPITLGNMRANGVRSLDRQCHHEAVLSADRHRGVGAPARRRPSRNRPGTGRASRAYALFRRGGCQAGVVSGTPTGLPAAMKPWERIGTGPSRCLRRLALTTEAPACLGRACLNDACLKLPPSGLG
jgi:hypothetical protein